MKQFRSGGGALGVKALPLVAASHVTRSRMEIEIGGSEEERAYFMQCVMRMDELVAQASLTPMTEQQYEAQRASFVIGNAFDVFSDPDTVTEATYRAAQETRLHPLR